MTHVYRHFDQQGCLLYVGCSLDALRRQIGHQGGTRWFDQVTRIEIERFATHKEALIAERRAIKTEKPKFNNGANKLFLGVVKRGKRGRPLLGERPMSAAERSARWRAAKRRHK